MNTSIAKNPAFNREKFLSLPLKRQHKHASRILRDASLELYRNIEKWLALEPVEETFEALSNRYHFHLQSAQISLNEDKFLSEVRHFDRLSLAPFLPYDIYLDHLRSCHNIGNILRTTEAFRLGTVHFSLDTPFIDHTKIPKSAMGTESLVPCKYATPLQDLRRPIIAIETAENATSLYDYSFPDSGALLFGNEEYGLSKEALAIADVIVEIPLFGSKNSLNVAASFAIVASTLSQSNRSAQRKRTSDALVR